MKILLIDVYHYNKGGAETVCYNTGKLLEEQGHDVIYFSLKWKNNIPSPFENYFPESKESRKGPLKLIQNLIAYFYHKEAALKIEQLIKNERPDIVHIHLIWGQISPSIFPVLKKYNIPIVFTIHDYRIICPAYSFRNGKGEICEACQGKHFYKCFTNKCTKGSYFLSAIMAAEQYFRNSFFNPAIYIDSLIYVSSFARSLHEKYMPQLVNKQNIVLHNFTFQNHYNFDDVATKQNYKYFLFFGRLSEEKGLITLLNAFNKLPNLHLKIVGTGPLENKLKKMNHEKNIEFLGYKTGRELEELIKGAYFTIVPSEWYENNPMSIIESYSYGIPVIASNIGGIPEIVTNNKTGYIFEPKNVSQLISQIDKANSLSSEVYKEMVDNTLNDSRSKFDSNLYIKKLLDFYKKTIIANELR